MATAMFVGLGPAITPPDLGDRIRAILGLRMPHSTRCDMTRPIGAAVSVLLVAAAVLAAQDQTIRRPANLPEPVGEDQRVQAPDIDATLADPKVVLLDVREPWELEKFGTREGYVNIPLAELEDRLDELPKDKTILTA